MRTILISDDELARVMGGETITMQFADADGAYDLRRAMRAVHPVIPVEVCGKTATFDIKHLGKVREYLHGEISPDKYRKHMPKDYYGYTGSIYYRQ